MQHPAVRGRGADVRRTVRIRLDPNLLRSVQAEVLLAGMDARLRLLETVPLLGTTSEVTHAFRVKEPSHPEHQIARKSRGTGLAKDVRMKTFWLAFPWLVSGCAAVAEFPGRRLTAFRDELFREGVLRDLEVDGRRYCIA